MAIAAPRGSAKSTLVSLEYVLYLICHKLEPFIILISSTGDQAARLLANIKRELEENKLLAEDFPEVSEFGTKKPGPPRWRQDGIITRNGVEAIVLTPNKQIRGVKSGKYRPSLIILDDFEADSENQTPEYFYKLHEWFSKSVLNAGDGHTNFMILGTIHRPNSFLDKYTDPQSNPAWIKRIYRAVITWSESKRWEDWTNILNYRNTFQDQDGLFGAKKYFEAYKDEMLKGTQVLWPEKMSYYWLMLKRNEDEASFDAEYQNMPVDPRTALFPIEELCYWSDRFSSQEALLYALGRDKQFYGACDPSIGRQQQKGDYSAIISAVCSSKGIIYVLDASVERRSPDKTINDILFYCQKYRYERFVFEKNGFQEFMRSELERRGAEARIYPPLFPITSSRDKKGRIESLQPMIKKGLIRFSRKHRMLLEQMKYYPKGHDDALDALHMLVETIKASRDGGPKIHVIRL